MKIVCNIFFCFAAATLLVAQMSCSTSKSGQNRIPVYANQLGAKSADNLSDNDRQRFNYFFLESENQEQKGNLAGAFDLLTHCLDIDSTAPEVYYKQAQYYAQLKKDSLAMLCFERATAGDPSNSTYNEVLAQYYTHMAQYDKAIAAYEQLYANNHYRSDVLEILLQLYSQKNDYQNVINTLNRLEIEQGSSEKLSMAKVQVYSSEGKKKEAYKEIVKLSESHPNDLNYRVLLGDWQMENNMEKEGLATYDKVLKQEPDNTLAQMSMLSYYKSKSLDSLADKQLKKLLTDKPVDLGDKLDLMKQVVAESEQNGGDSTSVLNLFKDALKDQKDDADMYILCGAYMNAKKMPHDTIAVMLNKVLDIAPDNAAARLQLIQYAWEKKDYNQAIVLCKPAIEYNPDEMAFFYYLGMAYYLNNNLDDALNTFRKGTGVINAQSDPSLVSDYYGLMGDILHTKGEEASAFAAYDSCLQWKDNNVPCLNNYAYYLSEKGKNLDKAEQMSYKTIKAEPKNSTYLDTYAWILFMEKRYAEAKIYIDQAVLNDTLKSSVILEHAGDIYARNNDISQALVYWHESAKTADTSNKLLFRKIKLKKYLEK